MNMLDFRLYLFLNVHLLLCIYASIPEEKLCANLDCTEPISEAKGNVLYNPDIKNGLGFQKGQKIVILSKSKDTKGYWGAFSNGKFGYVPSELIKEIKIYHKTNTLVAVKTGTIPNVEDKTNSSELSLNSEIKNDNNNNNDNSISSSIKENGDSSSNEFSKNSLPGEENKKEHDSVLPVKPFSVIEGTTVFNEEFNEISSSPATPTKIVTHTAMPELSNLNQKSESEQKPLKEDKNIFKIQESNYQEDNSSFLKSEVETNENIKFEMNSSNSIVSNAKNENEGEAKEIVEHNKNIESAKTVNLINEKSSPFNNSTLNEKLESNKTNSEVLEHEDNGNVEDDDDGNDDDDDDDDINEEEEEDDEEETKDSEEPVPITKNSSSEEINGEIENKKNGEKLVEIKNSVLNSGIDQNNIIALKETSNLQSNSNTVSNNASKQLNELPSKSSAESTTTTNTDMTSASADVKEIVNDNVEKVKSKNLENNDIVKPNNISPQIPFLSSPIFLNAQQVVETNKNSENQKLSNEESISGWNIINNSKHTKPPLDLAEKENDNIIAIESNLNPTQESANTESQEVHQTESNLHLTTKSIFVETQELPQIENNLYPMLNSLNAESQEAPQTNPKEDSNIIFDNKIQNSNINSLLSENPVNDKVLNIETTTENLNDNVSLSHHSASHSDFLSDNEKILSSESIGEEKEVSETAPSNFENSHSDLLKEKDASPQESNIFSQLVEGITSWLNEYSSSNPTQNEGFIENNGILPEEDNTDELTTNNKILTAAPGFCEKEECANNEVEEQPSFWSAWTSSSTPTSSNIFIYLIVTAVTVLFFTLGHNYIEAKGKTGPLIAKINKLEQEFLVTSKECLLLKDEVQNAREKIIMYENSANDELVVALQNELEESKKARVELESSMEVLQQELDAATEAGLDLNKMLSEVLTQKGGSESLLQSVENLQSQLNSQQKVIDEMTQKLGVKNIENETLSASLQGYQEKCESLEEELHDIRENMNIQNQEKDEVIENLKSEVQKLKQNKEQAVKKLQKNLEDLKKKLTDTSGALTVKEEELKILKNSVQQIKGKGNIEFEKLFDFTRVNAELIKAEKDNETLSKKLEEEESLKKSVDDLLKSKELEIQQIKQKCEETERNKEEAEKKLEVLSTYFKEKETQLQKELGLQEALWAQKKGDEKAVYNMMKSLQEEIESYKSQNETLKKEILDQERGLKNQIATLEQKAHENWVAARQAERKLEENKQETAQLRNRLTLVEKNVNNDIEGKANHYTEDLNGVEAASPILHNTSSPLLFPPLPMDPNNSSLLPPGFMPPHPMFMPPPMGGFIPPPPFLPGDRRPPPLGRMSSPPLNNRFSPPLPPDFPLGRMTSPPLSPHNRNYRSPTEVDREREQFRHRTPPFPPMKPRNWEESEEMKGFIPISSQRDSRRDQKGSNVSSGHSSSDSLDQSSRHSGRV